MVIPTEKRFYRQEHGLISEKCFYRQEIGFIGANRVEPLRYRLQRRLLAPISGMLTLKVEMCA
jgi:hypothetical protein